MGKEKSNKPNLDNSLILKFLIPFGICLFIICTILYFIYTPQYRRDFRNEIETKISAVSNSMNTWVYYFLSDIDINASYISEVADINAIRYSFQNVMKLNDSIYNIYFIWGTNSINSLNGSDIDYSGFDWIKSGLVSQNTVISAPYDKDGINIITFLKSVKINGGIKGVIAFDISLNKLSDFISNYAKEEGLNANLAITNGIFITHDDKSYVLNETNEVFNNDSFKNIREDFSSKGYAIDIEQKSWNALSRIESTPWMIVMSGSTKTLMARYFKLLLIIFIVVIVLMSIETVLVFCVVKPLSNSLSEAILNINHMGNGDFSANFDERTISKNDQTGKLAKAIDGMQKSVGVVIYKLKYSIDAINGATSTISNGNGELSDRTSSQASSLEELASSIEVISSALKETAKNALEAKNMSDSAFVATKSGVEAVMSTTDNMREIADSSKKISDITKIIETIAFQTNILALNAAVEAARAGEQGRGFAVVATEVRNLAQTVSDAARNIGKIVEDTVSKIELGSESVSKSSKLLSEIEKTVNDVLHILIGISNSVIQEEDSIDQINQSVMELNRINQENSTLAQESAFASKDVFEKTENMVSEISYFRFKDDIKSSDNNLND